MSWIMQLHEWTVRVLLFGIILLLAGCGPRYDTRYVYTPPVDLPESRQCLQSCKFQRQQCLLIADNNRQFCELQAQSEFDRCEADARFFYARCLDPHRDDPERCRFEPGLCSRRTCWNHDGRCDELYRSCYTACGGTVRSETVCTTNCEDVPPLATP